MARTIYNRALESRHAVAPCDQEAADAYFTRVGRDGSDDLREALILLEEAPVFQEVIDAIPLPVAVLNDKGQAILINRHWQEHEEDASDCGLGRRHGELLGCVHATEGLGGCGTSRHCERCGAAITIVASQREAVQVTREYHLDRDTEGRRQIVDLRVSSTGIRVQGRQFFVFVVQDLP